jgi:hypothetical protein
MREHSTHPYAPDRRLAALVNSRAGRALSTTAHRPIC